MTALPEPLDIASHNVDLPDTTAADAAILAMDAELRERTVEFNRRARAAATLRAYSTDWAQFEAWCVMHSLRSLPADQRAVALYLTHLADTCATATIERKLTSISVAHRKAREDSPRKSVLVADTMEGIRRTLGVEQAKKKPARTDDVRALVATLDLGRPIGVRDRAILVVGFAGAFRRSEVAAFDLPDLEERGRWLYARVKRSKGDQQGKGQTVAIPAGNDELTCPLRALRDWLTLAPITEGPVFRSVTKGGLVKPRRLSPRDVARIVKRTAERAGMNPADYAGHSLRSGFITSAAEADVHERHIMRHSRHKSIPTVRGYIEEAELTRDNAAAKVGL
jgi:integrase